MCVAALLLASAHPVGPDLVALAADPAPATLAATRLFRDAGGSIPDPALTPYALNTPLFSDYSVKLRYVLVPKGRTVGYRADGVLAFPVGTTLVKTFAYPTDLRQPAKDVRFIETRLLTRTEAGWRASTYLWNAAQDQAVLKRVGATVPVSFIDAAGRPRAIDYAVPNVNQCRQCHTNGAPIGPTAANLNGRFAYPGGAANQLAHWGGNRLLAGAPAPATVPAMPRFDDPAAPLAQRARAYLAVNCAHCHGRAGLASNSGLYLDWSETDPTALGVGKRPVAAGRGSGGREVSIAPGNPDASILVHRMAATDPGVMMPQIGRTLAHDEGVSLVSKWIAGMANPMTSPSVVPPAKVGVQLLQPPEMDSRLRGGDG